MHRYKTLLDRFTEESRNILGENMVGIYLHGSGAMGCFNPAKSDLDLLIVVENTMTDEIKRAYMDMVIRLNEEAPAKGLELSVLRRVACQNFVHPLPFELHFSIAHRLMAAGKSPDTPAAVLSGGNSIHPACIRTTLEDLPYAAKKIQPPAIILVGEVAAVDLSH